MAKTKFDITKHVLVPKHTKLSKKERRELLEIYGITENELMKIHLTDPAIQSLGAEPGDIIKIERKSPTSGVSISYRVVIDA